MNCRENMTCFENLSVFTVQCASAFSSPRLQCVDAGPAAAPASATFSLPFAGVSFPFLLEYAPAAEVSAPVSVTVSLPVAAVFFPFCPPRLCEAQTPTAVPPQQRSLVGCWPDVAGSAASASPPSACLVRFSVEAVPSALSMAAARGEEEEVFPAAVPSASSVEMPHELLSVRRWVRKLPLRPEGWPRRSDKAGRGTGARCGRGHGHPGDWPGAAGNGGRRRDGCRRGRCEGQQGLPPGTWHTPQRHAACSSRWLRSAIGCLAVTESVRTSSFRRAFCRSLKNKIQQ